MWQIIEKKSDYEYALHEDEYETVEKALSAKKNEDDLVVFSGVLPESPENIHALEEKVKYINNRDIRLHLDSDLSTGKKIIKSNLYPSNCWCLIKHCRSHGEPDGGREVICWGSVECSYCNANGYCWVVDTGRRCGD